MLWSGLRLPAQGSASSSFAGAARTITGLLRVGLPLAVGLACMAPSAHAELQYIGILGSKGYGNGQFNSVNDLCVDTNDNVYVADSGNHRVQKFDKEGKFLFAFGYKGDDFSPSYIAVDSHGDIYVSETGKGRLDKFDSQGRLISELVFPQSGEGKYGARDIAIDSSGTVYALDSFGNDVLKLSDEGAILRRIPIPGPFFDDFGGGGMARAISIDTRGVIYVTITGGTLSPDGHVISSPGMVKMFDGEGKTLGQFAPSGFEPGSTAPRGVAINRAGDIFLVYRGHSIRRFDHKGLIREELTPFQNRLSLDGIAISSTNRIYVAGGQDGDILILGVVPTPVRPAMTRLNPDVTPIGSGETKIAVSGTNFTATSVVRYGEINLPTTYISSNELTAVVPASLLSVSGSTPVYVYRPESKTTSNPIDFTVPGEQPYLSGISSNEVVVGSSPASITLEGENFLPGMTVLLGGDSALVNYLSPTKLLFNVPGGYRQKATTYSLRILNPNATPPQIGTSNALEIRVVSPKPVIQTPSVTIVESSRHSITLQGVGFTTQSQVRIGKETLPVDIFDSESNGSGTLCTVQLPDSLQATVGDYSLTIVNYGAGGSSNSIPFRVVMGMTRLSSASTPVVTRAGTNLIVKVTIMNTGEYTARNVVVSGLLNGTANTAVSPKTFTLAAGTTKAVTLAFPASAAARGTTPTLRLNLTCSNAPSSSPSVTTATVP